MGHTYIGVHPVSRVAFRSITFVNVETGRRDAVDASPGKNELGLETRRRLTRRCVICARRLRHDARVLAEGPGVPAPQTWSVCAGCQGDVLAEVERSALQNPLRLRIAVGVVAARRERPVRYSILDDRFWEQITDEGLNRLLIWIFGIAFGVHAVAFALVAAYIAIVH